MTPVEVIRGDGPIVLGLPHTGTWMPEDALARLNDRGRALADTDWHVDRLYRDLHPGATLVQARFHRYLIDANRGPDDASLYPGQNTTGLCPLTDFDGQSIYRPGQTPDADEVAARTAAWHAPYHAALSTELARIRDRHGFAILYDCHSIRSEIPYLFPGRLPDFNIGTNSSTTCDPLVQKTVENICAAQSGATWVSNGRFKGGWTTRHYGRPDQGLHAIQMELAQSAYLTREAAPWPWDAAKSVALRATLARILDALAALAPQLKELT